MGKLKKELLLNVFIVSPILTMIWALFALRIKDSTPIDFGPFLPLVIVLLTLYPFNVCVSLINFSVGRWVKRIGTRIIIFNILGLLISILLSYSMHSFFLATYSSFIIFSVISILFRISGTKQF